MFLIVLCDTLEESMNEMTMRRQLQFVKEKLRSNAREISLVLGMIGVGICGFEFGFVQGIRHTSPPVVIERPTVSASVLAADTSALPPSLPLPSSDIKTPAPDVSAVSPSANCPFVGSRNSDKYHIVGCAVVKRIKPENRVCFTSEDDAKSKNYQPGCLKP